MSPEKTYELKVEFALKSDIQTKTDLKDYLVGQGIEGFVEGVVDNLDIPCEGMNGLHEEYESLGGDSSALFLYSYDFAYLSSVSSDLSRVFKEKILTSLHTLDTQVWQEGWKDSFVPIQTQHFYIYPPWEKPSAFSSDLKNIEIEPGMAFGTGQHETTQLVLRMMENHFAKAPELSKKTVFDVGIGSGILSIAAKKLGFSSVSGCDVEVDSQVATLQNAQANDVLIPFYLGDLRKIEADIQEKPFDLVLANILFVVLRQLITQLSRLTTRHLILCGLLTEERDEMIRLSEEQGLILVDEMTQNDWLCLLFRRN